MMAQNTKKKFPEPQASGEAAKLYIYNKYQKGKISNISTEIFDNDYKNFIKQMENKNKPKIQPNLNLARKTRTTIESTSTDSITTQKNDELNQENEWENPKKYTKQNTIRNRTNSQGDISSVNTFDALSDNGMEQKNINNETKENTPSTPRAPPIIIAGLTIKEIVLILINEEIIKTAFKLKQST